MTAKGFRSGFAGIIGRPNVGKSTLLNHIIKQKIAIMSDKPQTTRNKIQGILTTENYQIIFLDTPGIHKPKHKLGEYMVEIAQRTLREVDVVLHMVDATTSPGPGEEYIKGILEKVETPVFLIVNKIDAVDQGTLMNRLATYAACYNYTEVIPVSALTGDNTERLVEILQKYMPEGPQYYPSDVVTDQPERFIIAELIREKILLLTRDEIPHSVVVEVDEIEQEREDLLNVGAVVYVERSSQKGIIIGQGGQLLRQVGSLARVEIENLLGSKIFLELWVKVKKNWRKEETALRNFGYDRRQL
ncbi:MAG: GTPase Era [Bacillota bacterium]